MEFLVGFLVSLLVLLFVLLWYQLRRGSGSLIATLNNLQQMVQAADTRGTILAEKIAHLDSLPQVVGSVQVELRGLAERVATLEQRQQVAGQTLQALQAGLAETGATATALREMAVVLQTELARAKEGVTALQEEAKTRQELIKKTAESVQRLEAIIAGIHTKGAAGENILELFWAQLPAEWQVRDFRVGNKVVEFGLRLPNGLVLPIDSKWPATSLTEEFQNTTDPAVRQRLKKEIETVVVGKAREMKKYLEGDTTTDFGIVAVPDAVYELCAAVSWALFRENIVLVSYSMFLPYLLLVFQNVLRTAQEVDLERVAATLHLLQAGITALQEELEGRFAKALAMLNNSRSEMSMHLSRVSRCLVMLQEVSESANAAPARNLVPPREPTQLRGESGSNEPLQERGG